MKIHNFLECELADAVIHEGEGLCKHSTVFDGNEIDAPVSFINYTVVPPDASFGMHRHENNNEFYVVLDGEGVYRQGEHSRRVKKGDIMMNSPFTAHGIYNDGEKDLALLVFEVSIN